MQKRSVAALVSSLLVAGLMGAPMQASAVERRAVAASYDTVTEKVSIETRHGYIYAEVARPFKNGKMVKGPAILTYSPYSVLGRTDNRDLVAEGYVAVFADVVGTGNSGGCYDYGGIREKESGYDIVEWIAKQKWSTGKVAMTGGSYNGTTATATAVMDPPHLTTIIPEAAISRWYEYAYSGGVRYFLNNEKPADEGFDTPLAFDFGFAMPPPLEPDAGYYPERLTSAVTPCDEVAHTEHGYDDTPDYDKFWLERDYIDGPDNVENVDIPVLIAHNWGDWNVKQEEAVNLYRALVKRSDSPKVSLYMGNRYQGHGTPGGKYDEVKRAWLDHYLMGKDNGTPKLADVTSHMSDYDGATKWYSGKWPETRNITLYAQNQPVSQVGDYEWKLLPSKPRPEMFEAFGEEPPSASFPATGANIETHANHHTRSKHEWWWFETPMLKEDLRVFGEIKVQHYSEIAREWVTLTPGIVDIKPSCHETNANNHTVKSECMPRAVQSVTRGFLDTRYRKGLHKQVMLDPSKPFQTTVATKPVDYTFKKGHYFGVQFQTEIIDWMVSKAYPGCDSISSDPANTDPAANADRCAKLEVLWAQGKTRLILPVVNGPKDVASIFDYAPHNHGDDCLVTLEGNCVEEP
jgi:predicted acyl esterase